MDSRNFNNPHTLILSTKPSVINKDLIRKYGFPNKPKDTTFRQTNENSDDESQKKIRKRERDIIRKREEEEKKEKRRQKDRERRLK